MAVDLLSCLTNVVGLTERECVCYENQPAQWATINESKSGLYVDNLQHGPDLSYPVHSSDCAELTIYDVLNQARSEGVNNFITQYLIALEDIANSSIDGRRIVIGQIEENLYPMSNIGGDIVGEYISASTFYKGIQIHLKSIGIYLDTTGSYDLKLINLKWPNVVLDTFTINAVSDQLVTLQINKAFNLYDEYGHKMEYAIIYDKGDAKPYSIRSFCSTCLKKQPDWHKERLLFTSGISSTSQSLLTTRYNSNVYTHGLIIDLELRCSGLDWICQKEDDFFLRTSWGRLCAKVIQLSSDIALITTILDSASINSYTTLNHELLMYKRSGLKKNVDELIPWLAMNQPSDVSDCHTCQPAHGFRSSELII